MGVYSRFKRGPEGFRALVELLESAPHDRRQKMIEKGMEEDVEFTERAMSYMLTFEDVSQLSDPELAEVLAIANPRIVACALQTASPETRDRFLKNTPRKWLLSLRDFMEVTVSLKEVGGARLKLIEVTRSLERKGLIRIKRIPD